MPSHRHDPDSKIKILKSKIPANSGTRLHAGYVALKKLEGKKYQEFRDLVGTKPRRPKKDDRAFSPADTIRHAIDNGYVQLVSTGEGERNSARIGWSRNEVELTVADYFEMFDAEKRGEPFNKAQHRRALRLQLNNRTEAAIELKHQNISAVLDNKGLTFINGYKPRGNYQALLAEFVMQEAERRGLTSDGGQYPVTSFSWVIYSPTVAVKQMDKSAFLHHGTGVPRDVAFFFDFKHDDDAKTVWLVHADKRYEGHLSPDFENQRVRLFWQSPFSKLIEGMMPGRHRQFSDDDGRTVTPAEMRFVKQGDGVYVVDFLEPETIIEDAENPDEAPSGVTARKEGAAKTVTSTQYERDPQNRLDAIRLHGHQCIACGFDFGQFYGERGEGYIEVHHLTPLAQVDEGHEVNPETDLAPVCANCHRMIHRRRGDTLSIDELRELVQGKIKD